MPVSPEPASPVRRLNVRACSGHTSSSSPTRPSASGPARCGHHGCVARTLAVAQPEHRDEMAVDAQHASLADRDGGDMAGRALDDAHGVAHRVVTTVRN